MLRRSLVLVLTIAALAAIAPATAHASAAGARYRFPVAGCKTSYGRYHHDYPATDIFAAKGCAFVSPVAGRIDEVSYVDRWRSSVNAGSTRGGLSVAIVGDDGVRYYGSHLSSLAAGIRPGKRVSAGQLLGRVGDTGSARGIRTHLHFGISWPTGPGVWWVRRGMVGPAASLDSWRSGGQRSPVAEVRQLRQRYGGLPRCRVAC
jgi:murein DD-endopeptidase MepM/ murein hydrolase activator NlpD